MNQHSKQRFYFTKTLRSLKVCLGEKILKKGKVLLGMYYFSQMTRLYCFFI